MELIQEIGSYAGLAAVVGLAVLSALYFSQARDVKRLREWAGRAPERVETPAPAPGRVVAQPVPRPPVPKPPGVPAKPAAATPAAAAAAGAAPAVATGPPVAPTETDEEEGTGEDSSDSSNGTDEHAVLSQDTEVHPPPAPPDEDEDEGDEEQDSAEADAIDGEEPAEDEPADPDPDRAPAPEDFHEDFDPDSEEYEYDEDTGDEPAVAAPPIAPAPPSRPTIPIGGTSRSEPTGILPPYEESRPGGRAKRGGGLFSSPGRAVAVVGGSLLALLVIGFGILQLTGGDDEPATPAASSGSAQEEPQETTPARKQTPGVDPSKVRVAVLNGTTVPGLAAQIGDSVERQGFQLGTVTNFIDQQRAESVVKYAPGAEREAADVGKRLKISQREPIDAESQGLAGDATVVVVAGADKTQ